MLGVDVGGTFTDVVSVRDGRIEVTKVPSSRTDPAAPVVEGAERLGVEGRAVFNHASTMGLNAVITRTPAEDRVPDHRGPSRHPRPRHASGARRPRQTDPSWRRPFGDAARPARPALPAPRRGRAPPRRRQRAPRARRGAGAPPAEPCSQRCDVEGVAICLLNAYVNDGARACACASSCTRCSATTSRSRSRPRPRRSRRSTRGPRRPSSTSS